MGLEGGEINYLEERNAAIANLRAGDLICITLMGGQQIVRFTHVSPEDEGFIFFKSMEGIPNYALHSSFQNKLKNAVPSPVSAGDVWRFRALIAAAALLFSTSVTCAHNRAAVPSEGTLEIMYSPIPSKDLPKIPDLKGPRTKPEPRKPKPQPLEIFEDFDGARGILS